MEHTDIHLLIIDDLEDNRTLLRADLEDEISGIRISEATNGEDALRMMCSTNYTLAICDVLMPQMDGFSVLIKAREHALSSGVPFLFLSALRQQETIKKGLELGAVDFLVKPYDIDELVNKVRNLARIRQLQVELEASQKQLIEANALLQRMNEEKNSVMQIVSHDLRSPLSGIRGLANILQTEEDASNPTTVREFSSMIADTADSLIRLVNDLMNIARMEAGVPVELQCSPCDMSELLQSCIGAFARAADKKNINVSYGKKCADTTAVVDEAKVRHVVGNLLSNAIKFTNTGGAVYVELRSETVKNQAHWIIEVRDTGIGIPSEQLPQLFEHFANGQRPGTNNERGVGLGLPLVRFFAGLHNGEVVVHSKEGEGTAVEVHLPQNLRVTKTQMLV